MIGLIEKKVSKSKTRIKKIQKILEQLQTSDAQFSSERKLTVFIADTMNNQGDHIDSSTLRRRNSPYKELISSYFSRVESTSLEISNTASELQLRSRNKEIIKLKNDLSKAIKVIDDKEEEITTLLINQHKSRQKAISSISPPKATIYKSSEILELKSLIKKQEKQLEVACKVIHKLINDDLKGTYEAKGGRVVDLLNDSDLFSYDSFEAYFRYLSENK
ncbi:hypothetical protein [Celerinatantimonas sp. MCCC 1A17872]|uniref:hypothetical protein n=1 Tax=Celerinatantimonas sp. MCCC 1A17872 TaxID=3177514 RepID=UPI0038C7123E